MQTVLVGGLIMAIAAGAAALVFLGDALRVSTGPGPNDRSREVADLAPWSAVTPVANAGWVAELPTAWSADNDPARLAALCDQAFARLGGGAGQTLTILGGQGEPIHECGAAVGNGPGPRATAVPTSPPPAGGTPPAAAPGVVPTPPAPPSP